MASGAVMGRFRQLYARADKALQQWDSLHASAAALATTCVNIILRLPALQDVGSYGSAPGGLAEVQHELLGRQMQSFERHMAVLRELTAELEGVARAVGRLAADGTRVLREARVTLESPVAKQQIGAAPSLASCIGGLNSLRLALADECRLHAALLAELKPGAEAGDLATVQQLLNDQPNLARSEWEDALLQVSLTGQGD